MEDVIVPQQDQLTSSYPIEDEKPLDVITQEMEQKALERALQREIADDKFPVLRKNFEELIASYGDVTALADLAGDGFVAEAKARAIVVKELRTLLSVIDQVGEVESLDGTQ